MSLNSVIGWSVILALLLAAVWLERRRRKKPPQARRSKDPLDEPLLWWSETDAFTVRDLLNGGGSIIGRAGSGKTSSSGREIGNAVIAHKQSGGLILAAKPEDAEMWARMFEKAGRRDDLLIFSPDAALRFNILGYVLAMGGHTRDVTRCITTIGETLRTADTKGGESSDFWEREQDRMIYNAVEVVKLATGTVSAPDIQRFITGAAQSPAMIATPEWQAGFHNKTMEAAFNKQKSPIEQHDYQLATDYWLNEYPSMADKTRSSILTGVMGIMHVFNTGVVRELVSTTTNVSPDDMLAGKWVLVNMSPAEWGDMGALVCAGWKFLTQKRVLRRAAKEGDCINVIWCDEAQQFVNSFDAHYLAQCRSHMGCMVFLTQSLHSYYSSMHGPQGRSQADALLTNYHTKVFHALGDAKTAEFAQSLLGNQIQTFIGTSTGPQENAFKEMMGRSKVSTSTNEKYESVLQTNVFMNGLRTGGIHNDLVCDAIVIRSGEPFSNGASWLWVPFSQKG